MPETFDDLDQEIDDALLDMLMDSILDDYPEDYDPEDEYYLERDFRQRTWDTLPEIY